MTQKVSFANLLMSVASYPCKDIRRISVLVVSVTAKAFFGFSLKNSIILGAISYFGYDFYLWYSKNRKRVKEVILNFSSIDQRDMFITKMYIEAMNRLNFNSTSERKLIEALIQKRKDAIYKRYGVSVDQLKNIFRQNPKSSDKKREAVNLLLKKSK